MPLTLITATLPSLVVGMLFPARYGDVGAILPWSAFAGLAMGVVNLTTTYFQAAGIFRRTTSLLALGVVGCAGPRRHRSALSGSRSGRGRDHRGRAGGVRPPQGHVARGRAA